MGVNNINMHIFLSFSGLISKLSRGIFSIEDLQNAIYWIGCSREILDNWELAREDSTIAKHEDIYNYLVKIIPRENVVSRKDNAIVQLLQINKLFYQKGLKMIELGNKEASLILENGISIHTVRDLILKFN